MKRTPQKTCTKNPIFPKLLLPPKPTNPKSNEHKETYNNGGQSRVSGRIPP